MTGQFEKRSYLTETEFSLCCAAAGIGKLSSFRFRRGGVPDTAETGAALFEMQRRGLLRTEGGALVLEPELSAIFRTVKNAKRVLELYQGLREAPGPCCLLYAAGDSLASVFPGKAASEYVGVSLCFIDKLDQWLEDWGLLLPGNPAEAPEGDAEDGEAWDTMIDAFLLRAARAADGAWRKEAPDQAAASLDCRENPGGALRARLLLVRGSLEDALVLGSAEAVTRFRYSAQRLRELVETVLREEEKT